MTRNYSVEDITFVIIGRNEAKVIGESFKSAQAITSQVIYVDSNSSDNSVEIARENGVKTIVGHKLNWATASYSRNIGASLVKTKLIHFLDGDETINNEWIEPALKFLNDNPEVAVVHGFKKVYKTDSETFMVLKDKEDWQPDYLQGACLVVKHDFDIAGGFDNRLFGEEERDLYVKLHSRGGKNWYIDQLMASHYDFKKRSLYKLLTSENNAGKIIPLINAIKNRHFISYIFVYRYLLACLAFELLPILSINFGYLTFLLTLIISQSMLLSFAVRIDRRGYFIFWKGLLLRLDHIPRLLNKDLALDFVRYD